HCSDPARCRRMMRPTIRAVAATLICTAACKSSSAKPAIKCADPCCGGHTSIDCAEEPNVACVEDADVCSARIYGCMNGRYYLMAQDPLPAGCEEAGPDMGGLVLGDGGLQSDDAESGTSSDAPDDATAEAAGD
ncbi:MAG: hypothetical protein M3O46_16240, partial [Myxococcota bacterium]|nr:hypothetical protein [Myxococcota bacterium]